MEYDRKNIYSGYLLELSYMLMYKKYVYRVIRKVKVRYMKVY